MEKENKFLWDSAEQTSYILGEGGGIPQVYFKMYTTQEVNIINLSNHFLNTQLGAE